MASAAVAVDAKPRAFELANRSAGVASERPAIRDVDGAAERACFSIAMHVVLAEAESPRSGSGLDQTNRRKHVWPTLEST